MVNELIKVSQNENGELLVSARDLHEFLILNDNGKGTEFAKWFKRMCDYGFEENVDYVFVKNDEKSNGRPQINYALKIDMAKEIAMIQRNEKGKQARKYFIECERKLKEQIPQLTLEDKAILKVVKSTTQEEVMMALVEYREVVTKPLVETIEKQQPKIDVFDSRFDGSGLASITDVNETYGLKRGQLKKWAKDKGYFHKTNTEVNQKGKEFFKVYLAKGYKTIGVTESGLKLIKDNLEEIKEC